MTTATILRAFHGDPAIKAKYINRVRAHREFDQLVKGCYWENGKGCAIGCTIHGSNHGTYEDELGIPESLARLEDAVFEGLPNGHSLMWPENFLEAIPVGADLSRVTPLFVVWLLTGDELGLLRIAEPAGQASLRQVAGLWQCRADGDEPSSQEWDAATDAAWDAARAVATAASTDAARAASTDAATDAARAAAAAVTTDAARAVATDAAWDAAWDASWEKMAVKLLKLLAAAPVV